MMGITNPENTVAIPEWYAEEGYNQAIDDIDDWWNGWADGLCVRAWASPETKDAVEGLRALLLDKRKEQFRSEPEEFVAIPEWFCKPTKSYGKDPVEQGYNQAMKDVRDWWADNTHVQLGQTKFYVDLSDVLRDKKKSRFHPESSKPVVFTDKDHIRIDAVVIDGVVFHREEK